MTYNVFGEMMNLALSIYPHLTVMYVYVSYMYLNSTELILLHGLLDA